jgi:hypothetical protein
MILNGILRGINNVAKMVYNIRVEGNQEAPENLERLSDKREMAEAFISALLKTLLFKDGVSVTTKITFE